MYCEDVCVSAVAILLAGMAKIYGVWVRLGATAELGQVSRESKLRTMTPPMTAFMFTCNMHCPVDLRLLHLADDLIALDQHE